MQVVNGGFRCWHKEMQMHYTRILEPPMTLVEACGITPCPQGQFKLLFCALVVLKSSSCKDW